MAPPDEANDAPHSTQRITVDVRNPSVMRELRIDVPADATVAQLKPLIAAEFRATRCAAEGWPRVGGVRCIANGRVLEDAMALRELASDVPGIVMHVVIQPDAWVPHEHVPESLDTPTQERSDTQRASAENGSSAVEPAPLSTAERPAAEQNNPLLAFVEQLPRSDLPALAHALYVTYEHYANDFARLRERHPDVLAIPVPPMVHVAAFDFAPALAVLRNATQTASTVALVETQVMLWPPMVDKPLRAREHRAKYTPVTLGGLPYLRRTFEADTDDDARARGAALCERLAFLNDAMVSLERLDAASHTPTPSAPPAHVTLEDLASMLRMLLGLSLHLALAFFLFLSGAPLRYQVFMGGTAILYAAYQAFHHVQRRIRERQPPAPEPPVPTTRTTASANATDPSSPSSTGSTQLELPRLPHRRPTAAAFHVDYWMQRVALWGLESEEAAMGFEHVPPTEPLRITWEPYDWAHVSPPLAPPPSTPAAAAAVTTAAVGRAWFFALATFIPRIEEIRYDAIALRRDAILTLARKCEQLKATGAQLRAPPPMLTHPYAVHLLGESERAS